MDRSLLHGFTDPEARVRAEEVMATPWSQQFNTLSEHLTLEESGRLLRREMTLAELRKIAESHDGHVSVSIRLGEHEFPVDQLI